MIRFVRVLYGIYDRTNRLTGRRYKIDNDIARIKNNKKNPECIVYVFGQDNYKYIQDQGYKAKLVDNNPAPFDLTKNQYLNKMHLIYDALNDYAEVIYLDWDVDAIKDLNNEDIYAKLRAKELLQGNLQVYRRIKCNWRTDSKRTVINGGCLYIGWKGIMQQAIDIYNKKFSSQPNDELAYTYLIDDIMGGFDMDKFKNNYEIDICKLQRNCPILDKNKDTYFIHNFGRNK